MAVGSVVRNRTFWWVAAAAVVVLVAAVLGARAFTTSGAGQDFLASYPGTSELPEGAPSAASWWLQWTHALNFFIIILLIRSGWMVHSQQRPEAYWTSNRSARGGPPTKVSIYLWLHLMLDIAWIAVGAIFVILLFVAGGWQRIVPVHWDIFPNAISAALQYLSLDWPTEDPWVAYNALQVLAYFTTVFIAAPVAAISGVRMSPLWNPDWRVSKVFPVQLARAVHLPTMFYFAAFIVVHVTLVFTTGMRRNLNYMFSSAGQHSTSWWGLPVFALTLLIVIAGVFAARPMFLAPIASMTGRVSQR